MSIAFKKSTKKMGTQLAAMGIQKGLDTAQDVVNTGLGLLLEGHNDRRQIRQQQKLTDMQFKSNAAMAEMNQRLQLEMWEKTNYSAQKKQLEKAGLNPGLLYGMGGAGGATTGSGGGAGVSGGQAPSGGGEVMGMIMQKQLMEAQIKNIEADTQNKQADTANKPIQGKNIEASTASITQGIENQKTQNALMEAQKLATNINAENTQTQTKLIEDQIMVLDRDIEINNATKEDKIKQIKAEAANSILTGEAIKQGISLDKAQIQKMSQDIAQGWENININKFKAEIEANFKGIGQIAGNLIEQIFHKIDSARGKRNDQRPIKIK